MAIEKMVFLNVYGPVESFSLVAEELYTHEVFHPEQSAPLLAGMREFYPFSDINPYEGLLKDVDALIASMGGKPGNMNYGELSLTDAEAGDYALSLKERFEALEAKRLALRVQISDAEQVLKQLMPILAFDSDLERVFSLEYIRVRIGRLPRGHYDDFLKQSQDNHNMFHIPTSIEDEYVWGLFIAPVSKIGEMDTMLASMHFFRVRISGHVEGTPKEAYERVESEAELLRAGFADAERERDLFVEEHMEQLQRLRSLLAFRAGCFSIRRFASRTTQNFYLAGWCPERELEGFQQVMEKIEGVYFVRDEPGSNPQIPTPPTRLRNLGLFKPFEFFVKMYGLPRYGEFDPTPLVAIIYTLFFSMMFGDMGQGLVLSAVGLLLWRLKRMELGRILAIVGVASAAFGVLYGSVFGFEIEGFGYHTLEPTNLNMTLMVSVGLGVLIISMSMIINIINGARQKNMEKMIFSHNGLMGLVFYWAVIAAAVSLLLFGRDLLGGLYVVGFIAAPLVFIFLRGPMGRLASREKDWMPENKGEYVLENSFDLFETILSFITTTFSFLRIGAYAMSHAGMMMVVYILAENTAGAYNPLVVVLGNVFVIAMEGLIVGVQCLRLDFYEIFSRFFDGTGKPFAPIAFEHGQRE